MMLYPPMSVLAEKAGSRYLLVNLVARRARNIAAAAQAAEHQLFLDNEEKYYNQLQEQGMEFIEVDTDAFAKAMIDGVLPILTDSQKKIYDAIAALA